MNPWVNFLNHWSARLAGFALPMLWQSSLLILTVFALDWLLRRRLRPAVRYALWTLVLLKLVLPPSFALPTSVAWWLRSPAPPPRAAEPGEYVVTYGPMQLAPSMSLSTTAVGSARESTLSLTTMIALGAAGVSLILFGGMISRSRQIRPRSRGTSGRHTDLQDLFAAARAQAGLKRAVRLELTSENASPAVYGLFRPVILLPHSLIDRLDLTQLRAVLLHELFHIKRWDSWIHCVQCLLQIIFWWHPLLWLANARMRQLREQAVDDAVMLALRTEAESYVPALFQVAAMVVKRPAAALSLVSILESRRALKQRIERLLDFHPPRTAGLTAFSLLGLMSVAAVALPMGVAPAPVVDSTHSIVKVADKPIQYSLRNEQVVFEPRGAGQGDLYVRSFQISYALFLLNLRNWLGLTDPADLRDVHQAFRERLVQAGVDLRPPKSMFCSTSGHLVVRATSNELFKVESILRQINDQPPPPAPTGFAFLLPASGSASTKPTVDLGRRLAGTEPEAASGATAAPATTEEQVLARIIKVDPDTFLRNLRLQSKPEWSVDRSLREFLDRNVEAGGFRAVSYDARVGSIVVTATAAKMEAIEAVLQTLLSPQVHIRAWFFEFPSRDWQQSGFGWEWQALNMVTQDMTGNWTSILSEPQGQVLLRALEQRSGRAALSAPQIITLSGRQGQIQIAEMMTLLKGINPAALHSPGVKESEMFLSEKLSCGPVLDLLPIVQEDGRTIELKVTAQLTEFLGYDENAEQIAAYIDGAPRSVKPPKPQLRVRTLQALSKLSSGRMLVLGNPSCATYRYGPDGNTKVEMRQESNLLVLVTPTIVDAVGNPVPNLKSR